MDFAHFSLNHASGTKAFKHSREIIKNIHMGQQLNLPAQWRINEKIQAYLSSQQNLSVGSISATEKIQWSVGARSDCNFKIIFLNITSFNHLFMLPSIEKGLTFQRELYQR